MLLETSNIGAPPETLKSSFGWRGDARIHGMSSLSVGSLPSISDFLGACGEIVVIIPKGARVTSLADLHSWSETCLTAADAFLNTFGGCSLLTPQFMQEKVLSHGDETPNVHVLPVFVGPAAIVATSLLHLVIGYVCNH